MKRLMGLLSVVALSSALSLIEVKNSFAHLAVVPGDNVTAAYNLGGARRGNSDVSFYVDFNGNNSQNSGEGFNTSAGGLFRWGNGTASSVKVNGSNVSDPAQNPFYSLCIELNQFVASGSLNYNVTELDNAPNPGSPLPGVNGMTTLAADMIGWLYSNTSAFTGVANNGSNLIDRLIAAPTQVFSGALQLATWKLVYDGGADLTLGNTPGDVLKVTGGLSSATGLLAQEFLTAISVAGNGVKGFRGKVLALSSPDDDATASLQDQVIYNPGGSIITDPVPEPATLVIWGLIGGIGAVVGARYTRRQKA